MTLTTKLETVRCFLPSSAPEILGNPNKDASGVQRVPVVFSPWRTSCSCHVIIPKGFVALVNRHGRYVGMWTEGFYWAPFFISISHLIPTQYVVYDTPVKECPTQDNVMVTIDVALIFRIMTDNPQKVYDFCYKLGPRGLDEMLRAFQEESIRDMARKRRYNDIYDMMDSQQDKQMAAQRRSLNEYFEQYGVVITDISVTNVHLPKEFRDTMQEATVWHNRNEFKNLQQEYEMRVLEVRESQIKSKQKLKEELEQFVAEQDAEVAKLIKRRKLVDAETRKILAEIREQQEAEVLTIKEESKLVVAELNQKRDVQLSKIRSSGTAQAEQIRIEAETHAKERAAFSAAEVAKNTAIALKLTAEAEAFAAQQLQSKRQYEAQMRQLQTLRALANNSSVAITGNSKDNVMAQLLANQKGGAILGLNRM